MSKKIQQSATLVKKKGRCRTATSLLLFELDDKNVEHLLGENKLKILRDLYEKMKAGCKLLFVSKQDAVVQRLQQEIPFNVEIQLLKDRNHEKMREEIMKFVQQHLTDRIKPESSVYVGTIIDQKEATHHSFKFGTVATPSIYFGTLANMKLSQQSDDQVPSTLSPDKTEDAEFDHKELNYSYESKISSGVKYLPFVDEIDSSNSSGVKKFSLLNELQDQNNHHMDTDSPEKPQSLEIQKMLLAKQSHGRKELPVLYYSKIKDLNNRISCKLCQKLDQLKEKSSFSDNERDIKSPRSLPSSPVPEAEDSVSQLGKRKRNFEEDMFSEYMTNIATDTSLADDGIFNTSSQIKDPLDLMTKIKNINFEVANEGDARPIMKKLKTSEVKTEKQASDEAGANEVILEYKASIPGERPTTVHIYGRDLQKLEPNVYVNDTLIQFYLKLVQSEFMEDSRKSSIYIYNTYLIEKLKASTKEKNVLEEQDFEKAYNNVKKWTKDVDIFEKEFLLFPMHDKNQKHWSLFIVCYPEHFLMKSEEGVVEDRPTMIKPFMLYFDSLGMMDTETAKLIALYLEYEVMHKKPEIYQEIKNSFNGIKENRMLQVIVPFQDNYCDCGLYLLEYAERFMTDPRAILENIDSDRDKLHLFPKSIFKTKRSDIANLILELAKGNKEILQEYCKNREQRLELAKKDPDEFEEIVEEYLAEFLQKEFSINLHEFPGLTRDRLKLTYFLQLQEPKMAASMGNGAKM